VGAGVSLSGNTATYTLSTTGLTAGSHTVQATYTGDTTYAGSKGAFTINLTSASQPDFTFAPTSTTVNVASGSVAQPITFTVTPVNGFTGPVTFVLTSPQTDPYTWSWTANPLTVTGTSAVTTTLTLNALTPAVAKSLSLQTRSVPPSTMSWKSVGSGFVFAGLLVLLVPRRRKFGALAMLVVAAGALSLGGCADDSAPAVTQNFTKTPTGTYSISVLASGTVNGTTVTHTSAISFVVQ
jgi:hypothetical protein